jgi:hypothetical protein
MRWKPKPLRVKIRRALWTIKFEKPPGNQDLHGRCFHNQRTIYVRVDNYYKESLIHETVHAAIPWASEAEVCDAERAISEILAKIA